MMGSHELRLIVKAIDRASATLKGVKGEVSALGSGFGQAADDARPLGLGLAAVGAAGTALMGTSTLTAARVEVLGTILDTVGATAGYTKEELDIAEASVKALGITTGASRQSLIQMIQSQLDVTEATKLARMAQDAAIIANTNSSEAYQTLITVVQRGSPVMARTLGLNVDFQGSYKRMSEQLGISTLELSANQKMQARLNEVLRAGVGIAGTYEAAMGDVGKRLTSLPRYYEEAGLALGKSYLPLLDDLVTVQEDLLKAFIDLEPEQQAAIGRFLGLGTAVAAGSGALILIVPKIAATITALQGLNAAALGAGIALGPIGLVAGGLAAVYAITQLPVPVERSAEAVDALREASYILDPQLYDLSETIEDVTKATWYGIEGWNAASPVVQDVTEYTDVWAVSNENAARAQDELTTAVERGYNGIEDYTGMLQALKVSVEGPVSEANENYIEQQRVINERLAEARLRLEELDPTQKDYTQSVSDAQLEIYHLNEEMWELDASHREVMKHIVYDMMMARLATQGWTSDETELALEIARGMGIIDEETWTAATSMNEALDSFYLGESVEGTTNAILGISNDLGELPEASTRAGQGMASGLQPGIDALGTGIHTADQLNAAMGRIAKDIHISVYWDHYGDKPDDWGGGPQPYQHGTDYVPQTGLALLHKGEAVIPAHRNTNRVQEKRAATVINNYFGKDSVRSDQDVLSIADAIRDALEIRGVQPAL